MGRYYSGDIEGKFWFGVQSSTAARRFGGSESEPNYINYYFSEDDLEDGRGPWGLHRPEPVSKRPHR